MSLHNLLTDIRQKIPSKTTSWERVWKPTSPSGIRKLQFFWAGVILLSLLGAFYMSLGFFFRKNPTIAEEKKVAPTLIETIPRKVDLNEVFRNGVEDKLAALSDEMKALHSLFHEGVKDKRNDEFGVLPESPLQNTDNTYVHELETKISQLERQLENPVPVIQRENNNSFTQNSEGTEEKQVIQKFSLGLIENQKHKTVKTVETTIPAGAFAKTILLSGLDAAASMNASSDPRPMLLRLIDPGTLPRSFQSDLKDCHCTASAFGDLSSERVYARLEKLSCIERKTGEIIETQVAGYIAGSDGKAGIRGVVASKDGQFLARSLVGGVFAGLSNVANPQSRQSQVNPFYPGSAHVSPPNVGDMFTAGMAGGASTALDRLSQYYIDRAEQLQPVIQIAAGQVVDIVFTEGTFIGSQTAHSDIKAQRANHQESATDYQQGE